MVLIACVPSTGFRGSVDGSTAPGALATASHAAIGWSHVRPIRSHGPHCAGCGEGNPLSLGLTFAIDGERVHAKMRLDERHQGAPGFAHGGLLATALDDVLGTLLYVLKKPGVTAKLEVNYRRPAFIHTDYELESWIDRVDGRKLHLGGVIRDTDGNVVAEADALFMEVAVEHFLQDGSDVKSHIKNFLKNRTDATELPY